MKCFSTKNLAALTFSIITLLTTTLLAQNNGMCGTPIPDQQWESDMQKIIGTMKQQALAGKQQNVAYTIPVIIHVIHGGQSVGTYPNLAQGQLVSQIQTLNNDYGGVGYNYWNYPQAAFVNWAATQSLTASHLDALNRVKIANCNVQFCLATKDTVGNTLAEPGIDRINYVTKGWNNPASVTGITNFQNYMNTVIKPASVWNVSKYLNIWVSDENINATGGLLGYATFPPLSSLNGIPSATGTYSTDGFWCYAKAFGSTVFYPGGTYYSGYDKGRTSTHEIGHYLGLRHIWGDGTCATDYCGDTPPANASNSGAPSYPYHTATCSGSNTPDGEMYMNFMDYTNDNGKYMYSPDQATRIAAAMSSSPYRKFLGTHNLCSVAAAAATASFNMASIACENAVVTLSNMTSGTPLPSYTWSATGPGSVSFIPNNSNALAASFTGAGTYTVTLTANNGNNTSVSKVINVGASPVMSVTTSQNPACLNEFLYLSASGANSYAWQPGSQTGSMVSYPVTASQVYTCVGIGTANCKTTFTINVDAQDCTGLAKLGSTGNYFTIFPNPASDVLHIQSLSSEIGDVDIQVVDALGHVTLRQNLNARKQEMVLNTTQWSVGVYFVKITCPDGKRQIFRLVKN